MTERENSKRYDLEERTYEFARGVRAFIKLLNKTVANPEDARRIRNPKSETRNPKQSAVLIMTVCVSSSPTLSGHFVELFCGMLEFSTKWLTKCADKVSKHRHS
jgi:hypothetical protein